ncbi:MAG: efflux RND transporter periplasmic adaptor subunit [Aestuariivita sp.]|nr:efflux RND transporter periplasmic adaptor subunit [Aestuariivita sp.]
MRVFPLITAVFVLVILYLIVFERNIFSGSSIRENQTTEDSIQENNEEDIKPISVVAMSSIEREIDQLILVSGTTEVNRQVEMRSEIMGPIASEPLRKGSLVTKDDLLCRIDPGTRLVSLAEAEADLSQAKSMLPAAEAQISEAKARLTEANLNLNATKGLAENGFASDSTLAAVEAAVEAAKASVQTARSQLEGAKAGVQTAQTAIATEKKDIEKLEIRAPFDGLLESDSAEIGSLLRPGDHCATIIQLNPIKLVGSVPESEIDKLQFGAVVQARLATGRSITGRVNFISKAADIGTRTFRVESVVPNQDLTIRHGQTAEMAIASGKLLVHLIPQSSLTLNDAGELGVRIVNNQRKAEFKPVSVVRDSLEGVFVNGLDKQSNIIIVGQEYVSEGMTVTPTFQKAE